MGEKHFCFFQIAETGNRTLNSGVKGSGANHYPRAPAHVTFNQCCFNVDRQSSTLARHWNSIGWVYRVFWLLHYAGDALTTRRQKHQITQYIGVVGTARWTDLSTRHHIKPSPKGSDLMWCLVLRWAHLAFPTMTYTVINGLQWISIIGSELIGLTLHLLISHNSHNIISHVSNWQ